MSRPSWALVAAVIIEPSETWQRLGPRYAEAEITQLLEAAVQTWGRRLGPVDVSIRVQGAAGEAGWMEGQLSLEDLQEDPGPGSAAAADQATR
jgi:hypothetical protein